MGRYAALAVRTVRMPENQPSGGVARCPQRGSPAGRMAAQHHNHWYYFNIIL